MSLLQILLLALVQGAAELLPVSSSAHVIVAERLMGLDPASPEMTVMLVLLHTGTMFAVLLYFWKTWREQYFSSAGAFWSMVKRVAAATLATGAVGLTLKYVIEKIALGGLPHAEIEMIFGNMNLIATALLAAGLLIVVAGMCDERAEERSGLDMQAAWLVGAIQGVCLPFRGFSRSGATISVGLILGVTRSRLEEFSFALAVVLTPPVIVREVWRLLKATGGVGGGEAALSGGQLLALLGPGLLGMCMSFLAGLLALRWLSRWLEQGRWKMFGYYCLCASAAIYTLHGLGYI